MPNKNFIRSIILFFAAAFLFSIPCAHAFWIWTPETGSWINPKYAVKPTPQEQLDFADGFFEMGKKGAAMREYRKLLQHYPRAREAAQAQFQVGRVWEELGKYYQAIEAYQRVVDKYPFSDLGPEVVKRQYVIANLLLEGKVRDSHFATSIFGNENNVVDIFRKIIRNEPYGEYAAVSQYKIGLFYLENNDFAQAREEFEKTVNDYPVSKWAESARYQIAVADAKRSAGAQYDQKITGAAVEGFKEYITANPGSELSDAAKKEIHKLRNKEAENAFVVAEYYHKMKKYSAAKIYYQDVVNKYANTVWADKAKAAIEAVTKEQAGEGK